MIYSICHNRKKDGSHFILSGFKYYVLTLQNKYNVLVFMLYCKTLFAAIEV